MYSFLYSHKVQDQYTRSYYIIDNVMPQFDSYTTTARYAPFRARIGI